MNIFSVSDDIARSKIDLIVSKIQHRLCPNSEEIKIILDNRALAIPQLLKILLDVLHWKDIPEDRTDAPCHAVFLLGALESKQGLRCLKKILVSKSRDQKIIKKR